MFKEIPMAPKLLLQSGTIPSDFKFVCVCSCPFPQISYNEHVVFANHADILIFVGVVVEVAEATSHI